LAISVLNTDAGLSGKTIVNAEDAQTITGAKNFDRDPSAPFTVSSGSAVVTNLDADKLDGLEATAFVRVDGTNALTAGLQFPASQNASTNANTLDDYEEGSWTPTLAGSGGQSGQAYTTQVGRYIKVGKLVTCFGRLTMSTLGTVTGQVQISGLPFTSDNITNLYGDCHINYWNNLTSSLIQLSGQVLPNTAVVTLLGAAAAATGLSTLAQADLANTTDFIFKVTYQASA
jgi:hypothetical protein